MDANKGQALIELIVAIAVTSILLVALTTGVIAAREGLTSSGKSFEANILLQKEVEALRSVRETAWNSIANPGTYHVVQSGNSWTANSGSVVDGEYNRGFTISNICRIGSTSSIVNCVSPEAIVDPSTKEVVASVSWSFLGTRSVTSTFYLSRYSRNQTWVQTTRAEFDTGTFDNTNGDNKGGGIVELSTGGGNASFTDEYTTSSDYTFDSNKIEVAGGFAQLKAQGSTVSGQTTNSGFDTDTSGWTFTSWGSNVSQTGSRVSGGGNPDGYVNINMPTAKNKKSGGYWYQAFTTTENGPVTTLSFDWKSLAYDPTPDSYHVYAFVDTSPGTPATAQSVFDSGNIAGTTNWSSSGTIDVSSRVTTAGTYYLKIAVYVDYSNKTRGPFIVGFDNASLDWSKTIGSYPTDSPIIYRNLSFSAPSISSWNSFSETTELNGGSIRYQLSDDNGTSWRYFNGSSWVNAGSPTEYNDVTTIDSNISSFPTVNSQINVRAFLISDGSQFVRLDQIVLGYTGSSTGTFISSSFDAGAEVAFNKIFWTEEITPTTSVKFQIASNNDNTTWNFVGPDGTVNTFFTAQDGIIPLNVVGGRYIQYKIFFTSSSASLPNVTDITVNYSP